MRSRFSAYCIKDYAYILATYAHEKKAELTEQQLEESASGTQWFALQVDTRSAIQSEVTFKAYYFANGKPAQLHETSQFIIEEDQWRYLDGAIHVDTGVVKLGRNEPCPCNSGKKFKQCCLKRTNR
ncbi:hypothetical protein GCM10007391_24000 [Alteromonas halophila]|uniref:YchJ-like middle NTF2-like domain-containing protein n=2 Tax=Alteromonas halophila TaxID=516698 RepID=A0A918JNC4_9ALTE|nr:hypothetical protein GCM10007391_24000 [Alteromonas halophila]